MRSPLPFPRVGVIAAMLAVFVGPPLLAQTSTTASMEAAPKANAPGHNEPRPVNPATSAFTWNNPDFNYRSLRGNAVLRWEWRPGSTLYLVWQQNRSGSQPYGDFDFSRDAGAAFRQHLHQERVVRVR